VVASIAAAAAAAAVEQIELGIDQGIAVEVAATAAKRSDQALGSNFGVEVVAVAAVEVYRTNIHHIVVAEQAVGIPKLSNLELALAVDRELEVEALHHIQWVVVELVAACIHTDDTV
jgi:hypothetical protein